ncbi:MAG: hypothetical protein HY298_23395 [Verrucomicrobia bacterium]|nr:hypothetical protein [Verrucomicrobiota bacterium]
MACDLFGAYLYARIFLTDRDDFLRFSKSVAIVTVPLAIFLAAEQASGRNFYGVVGGFGPEVRLGRVRAQGPFAHAILAGTIGGVCLPLVIPLLRLYRRLAITGCIACMVIVFSTASSGPIMTLFAALTAAALWRWRTRMRQIKTGVVLGIVGLALVMKAPIWYLIARIDFTGGSTGYHRAELITQAVDHLGDWWLVGTDYTRDWMPYGIAWSQNAVDITNYFLQMGVIGGLPLMLAFIAVLFKAFQLLGRRMSAMRRERDPAEFVLWCAGAALFAHCVTFFSITYFDQTYVFLFFVIGAVPGLVAGRKRYPVKVSPSSVNEEADSTPFQNAKGRPQSV